MRIALAQITPRPLRSYDLVRHLYMDCARIAQYLGADVLAFPEDSWQPVAWKTFPEEKPSHPLQWLTPLPPDREGTLLPGGLRETVSTLRVFGASVPPLLAAGAAVSRRTGPRPEPRRPGGAGWWQRLANKILAHLDLSGMIPVEAMAHQTAACIELCRNIAREYDLCVLSPTCYSPRRGDEGPLENVTMFITPAGDAVDVTKREPIPLERAMGVQPGAGPAMVSDRIAVGICNDANFPELWADCGDADAFIVPKAGIAPRGIPWSRQADWGPLVNLCLETGKTVATVPMGGRLALVDFRGFCGAIHPSRAEGVDIVPGSNVEVWEWREGDTCSLSDHRTLRQGAGASVQQVRVVSV